MPRHFLNAPFDAATLLKDAGAVTATGVGTVATVAKVVDIGAGMAEMTLQIDVSAIDTTTGDESYQICLQGSNSATFASGVVVLERIHLGGATPTGESAATGIGRVQKLALNSRNGMDKYRYLRINTIVAGTSPSINFTAFVTKQSNKSNG